MKTIVGTLVAQRVVSGEDGVRDVIGFACAAYNEDVNAEGVSPLQCVTGRQPRLHGSVLSNFPQCLPEHGLIDAEASASQRAALRESARVAMLRLRYSQSIRRAELARSWEPTIQRELNPGDVVFFWRAQKAVRNSRRKGILVALENKKDATVPASAFISYRGQLTKCALEHVRPASTLQKLAAGSWEAAIDDMIRELPEPPSELPDGGLTLVEEASDGEAGADPETIAVVNMAPPTSRATSSPPASSQPSTATPGTPVGHLLQRPVIQRSLSRAGGLPLEAELCNRALGRGQPADFQAELQRAMERGRLRRTSSEAGLDMEGMDRQTSHLSSEPPASVRRLNAEPSTTTTGGHVAPSPDAQQPPEPVLGLPASATLAPVTAAPAQQPAEPGPGPSDTLSASTLRPRGLFEALTMTKSELERMASEHSQVHPLLKIQAQVEIDRQTPWSTLEEERDHGTWDGRWSLPSRSQWEAINDIGAMLPTGASDDREVFSATARKEYQWTKLSEERKKLWAAAADKGWRAYTENAAVEVLDAKQSAAVRRNLAQRGELDRILTPRFVLTDKADGARTASNPLPIEASARLVVPGFRDRANLDGEIRKDAPTGCRLSQHLLLSLLAWHGKDWSMLSADVGGVPKGRPICGSRIVHLCHKWEDKPLNTHHIRILGNRLRNHKQTLEYKSIYIPMSGISTYDCG